MKLESHAKIEARVSTVGMRSIVQGGPMGELLEILYIRKYAIREVMTCHAESLIMRANGEC